MRKLAGKVFMFLAVLAMTSGAAFGGEKTEKVTFFSDIVVNGTVLKKGAYKVTFNDETGELTIFKDKKNQIKIAGKAQERTGKASETELKVTSKDNSKVLRSITFAGESRTIVLNEDANQVASPQ